MLPYIAEFLGTMILIILGDGVVANVNLNKSGMKGGGTVQITFAWGLAVMLPAFIFGAASGASFNPALTLALAVDGSFDWAMVPGYIIAQFAGAFVGAVIVYLLFKGQFDATEDQATKLGVFCTAPSIPNMGQNIFSEAVGTFILVFAGTYRWTWKVSCIWNHCIDRYVTWWTDRICDQSGKRYRTASCTCRSSD
jgi:glycerol uptake facilitator protein